MLIVRERLRKKSCREHYCISTNEKLQMLTVITNIDLTNNYTKRKIQFIYKAQLNWKSLFVNEQVP